MKHPKRQPLSSHVMLGEFVPDGNPPSSPEDLIAIVAGIATSYLIILSNVARCQNAKSAYPISEQTLICLNAEAKANILLLRGLLADEGYVEKILLYGSNNWNITIDEEMGLLESFSSTDFSCSELSDFPAD